jgi:hypothetical protein
MNLDVDDVVVLLLGAPSASPRLQGRIDGITRLEKMLFLLENEQALGPDIRIDAKFVAHNFGPFSAEIYKAVDILAAAEIVNDSAKLSASNDDAWESENLIYNSEDLPDKFATRDISLTERGRRYYASLIQDLPNDAETQLQHFKDQFGRMPLRQLIRYVYQKPEYARYLERSVIKDQVLGK